MTAKKSDIQRLIECCICCDYLTDVRETPCCHQLFCYACIQSWLNKPTKNCPRCRSTTLTEQNLLRNIVVQRFVDNLQFPCPYALQGCLVEIARCDLLKHKRLCSYSPEKLANKQRLKLEESRALLLKYKEGKIYLTDNVLFDLAKLFHIEHDYNNAKECLQMIKDQNKLQEIIILQAQIERDTNQYDKALELYTKAYSLTNSISQRIELLSAKGYLLLKKAQYEQAKDMFTQAFDLLRIDDQSQTKVELLNALGLIAKKCSDYDQAILTYDEALKIVDTNSNLWSDIISNLADIHRKKGNYNEARELYLKSLKHAESVYGQNHPLIADIMNNLALLYKKEGKYTEALDYLKQALKFSKHYYGQEHPTIGIYLTNVGDIYRKQGDFKTAEATYKEALTYLEQSYGKDHIEVAEVLNSMGLVLKKRTDYDGAEKYYKRAIEIVYNTFGHDQEHYKLGIYYNNLADLDRKRNKFDNALQLYQRALTSIEKTLGLQHSEAAEILHNIGQVQHQLGNYKQAIDYINRALIIIKREFNDKHYKYGIFLNSLGLSYAMINDYKIAYIHLKQALQILLNNLGSDHIEVCDVYSNLGDICMKFVIEIDQEKQKYQSEKQSKLDEAKQYYLEAQRIVQATFDNEHTKAIQFSSLLFIINNYNSLCKL
ncbi:unnamed protein product [Rotaria sordida]|uniref:RING-type domain-containing protein n=1 Tax=Rotaria sordida TaxID=392033 RepID=A0A814R759_9BILA|nr:unnamed protein product [Rotaria sordida]CAF3710149.1 unnamed protein product [Rotaria sordida]